MQRSLKDYCYSFLKEGLFSAEHIPSPLPHHYFLLFTHPFTLLFSVFHCTTQSQSHRAATSLTQVCGTGWWPPLLPAQLAASSTAPCCHYQSFSCRATLLEDTAGAQPHSQGTRLWFAAGHVLWQLLCGSALGKEGVLQLTLRFCS